MGRRFGRNRRRRLQAKLRESNEHLFAAHEEIDLLKRALTASNAELKRWQPVINMRVAQGGRFFEINMQIDEMVLRCHPENAEMWAAKDAAKMIHTMLCSARVASPPQECPMKEEASV